MYKLRELKKEDIKTINQWRGDAELIACLGAPFRYINEEVDLAWFDNYMRSRNTTVRCAVVDADREDGILGLVSLVNIDPVNRSCNLHIMIGSPENRGKGLGTFAVKEMIDHAFFNLNLRRIELGVLENNAAAIRLYEKLGFVKEGVRRESNYKNGRYLDMIVMGLLKSDIDGALS